MYLRVPLAETRLRMKPPLKLAAACNIPLLGEIEIAAAELEAPIIGITGTNGPRGTAFVRLRVSSMMATGGGTFSVMTLTLFNQPIHRAVGTAALFGLFISLPATLGFIVTGWGDTRLPQGNLGYVSLIGFAVIAPATVLTAPIGARVAHKLSKQDLSMYFGIFLFIVAVRLYYRALV